MKPCLPDRDDADDRRPSNILLIEPENLDTTAIENAVITNAPIIFIAVDTLSKTFIRLSILPWSMSNKPFLVVSNP